MGADQGDERSRDDLYDEVLMAGWSVAKSGESGYGTSVRFRQDGSTEERVVHGKDEADAMRMFLKELQGERDEEES